MHGGADGASAADGDNKNEKSDDGRIESQGRNLGLANSLRMVGL